MLSHLAVAFMAIAAGPAVGQSAPAVQSTGWNSSYELPSRLLEVANITEGFGQILNTIINFDRSQLANGGAHEDEFYSVPKFDRHSAPKKPGKAIKVQLADTTPYALPAKLAMSRIMYTSTNINGTLIPASGYILWPYQRKALKSGKNKHSKKAPVVLWDHGTSGFYANGAPSVHRSLFYESIVPFALAQAGYVVVAPDYAGLGVDTAFDGSRIPHNYFVSEVHAFDTLNALRAAQESYPDLLTDEFVLMGHSQGGSVAWKTTDLLAEKNNKFRDVVHKHLGTILIAPGIEPFSLTPQVFLPWYGKDLDTVLPGFNLSDWLTPTGIGRVQLINEVEASQMTSITLFNPQELVVQPNWRDSWATEAFEKLANPSRKPFKGPMVVIQGDSDPGVISNITIKAVEDTCDMYPGDLELITVPGGSHFGAIEASKQTWLRWIEDRFEEKKLCKRGCVKTELESFLPVESYHPIPNSFPQWAGAPEFYYELPTAA